MNEPTISSLFTHLGNFAKPQLTLLIKIFFFSRIFLWPLYRKVHLAYEKSDAHHNRIFSIASSWDAEQKRSKSKVVTLFEMSNFPPKIRFFQTLLQDLFELFALKFKSFLDYFIRKCTKYLNFAPKSQILRHFYFSKNIDIQFWPISRENSKFCI